VQIASTIDRVRRDGTEPALLRHLARCIRPAISDDILPALQPTRWRFAYLCGTTFRLWNADDEALPFEATSEGMTDTIRVMVEPHRRRDLRMDTAGAASLFYDGALVTTVPNDDRPCR
jgi:hypothetical protein